MLKLFFAALFLFVNGFFVAKVPDATRPELAFVSVLFVIVIAAPSFLALKNWLGTGRAFSIVAALGFYALFIETVAIHTGWPYGAFEYGDKIGTKIGVVPWTVFFSWSPLVLGAYALGRSFFKNKPPKFAPFLAISVAFLVAFDGVLDPGAVQQGFWKFDAGGAYYGVPLSNYFGWFFSGVVGVCLMYFLSGKRHDAPIALVWSSVLVLAFWTSIALFTAMWIPAILGFALLFWCFREFRAQSPKI